MCGAYGTPSGPPGRPFASIIDKRQFWASGETLFIEQLQTDAGSSSRSAPIAKLSVPKPRAKSGINDEGSVPMANSQVETLNISAKSSQPFGTHGKTPGSETSCYQCAE